MPNADPGLTAAAAFLDDFQTTVLDPKVITKAKRPRGRPRKLTDADIIAIRAAAVHRYQYGQKGQVQRDLASRYNVSQALIAKVISDGQPAKPVRKPNLYIQAYIDSLTPVSGDSASSQPTAI